MHFGSPGLKDLRKFDVSHNNLQGGFPRTLLLPYVHPNLTWIDVSYNYMVGPLYAAAPLVSIVPNYTKVWTANNCFNRSNVYAKWQRPVSVCNAHKKPP
eukprot:SM009628S24663  [mRNA]  locus=s9628:81:535:- [translate_table: standard]